MWTPWPCAYCDGIERLSAESKSGWIGGGLHHNCGGSCAEVENHRPDLGSANLDLSVQPSTRRVLSARQQLHILNLSRSMRQRG